MNNGLYKKSSAVTNTFKKTENSPFGEQAMGLKSTY